MTEQAALDTRFERVESQARSASKFFAGMAGLMFLGILVGFAPTFFLSPYFPVKRLPAHLILHGTILTLWFGLYFVQTSLIALGRKRLHARLGPYIAGASVLAIVGAVLAPLRLVSRRIAAGEDLDTLVTQGVAVIWINTAMLSSFITCLGLGVYFRKRPEIHKRLMFLAFISLYLPATARISRLPRFFDAENLIVPGLDAFLILFLVLALCVYDMFTRGRLHAVSALGAVSLPLLFFGALFVSTTEFAGAVVRFLA